MTNKRISDLEKKKIMKLYKKGWSTLKIATEMDRNEGTIRKHVKEMGLVREKPDLIGQVFGKLTVISLDHKKDNRRFLLCKCECGNTKVVREDKLKSGHIKSCGCLWNEIPINRKVNVKQVNKNYAEIIEYKLKPKELEKYLEELKTKEICRRK